MINRGKMVYSPDGEVFWDSMVGIRRWGEIRFDDKPKDTMYCVIPLMNSAPHWYGVGIVRAIVDDFGNLVRVQ
jgi:hypothetical protein